MDSTARSSCSFACKLTTIASYLASCSELVCRLAIPFISNSSIFFFSSASCSSRCLLYSLNSFRLISMSISFCCEKISLSTSSLALFFSSLSWWSKCSLDSMISCRLFCRAINSCCFSKRLASYLASISVLDVTSTPPILCDSSTFIFAALSWSSRCSFDSIASLRLISIVRSLCSFSWRLAWLLYSCSLLVCSCFSRFSLDSFTSCNLAFIAWISSSFSWRLADIEWLTSPPSRFVSHNWAVGRSSCVCSSVLCAAAFARKVSSSSSLWSTKSRRVATSPLSICTSKVSPADVGPNWMLVSRFMVFRVSSKLISAPNSGLAAALTGQRDSFSMIIAWLDFSSWISFSYRSLSWCISLALFSFISSLTLSSSAGRLRFISSLIFVEMMVSCSLCWAFSSVISVSAVLVASSSLFSSSFSFNSSTEMSSLSTLFSTFFLS